jgi:KAP family P-loop domain
LLASSCSPVGSPELPHRGNYESDSKAATLGALDAADITEITSVAKEIADETSAKADEYVKALLSRQAEERKDIEEFRIALSELASTLVPDLGKPEEEQSNTAQLIFIVDELDRCKPNFALELLEKVKHVFSVSGVHFILATHLTQLENSVRYSYGTDIDARSYLQKFYNLIVHFPGDSRHEQERISRTYLKYLRSVLMQDDEATRFIATVADVRDLTLRPIEKMAVYASLAIAFTTSKKIRHFRSGTILGGLCVLKVLEPELFQKAKSGTLTLQEASEAFQFLHWPPGHSSEWSKKWWQYVLDSDHNLQGEEWHRWGERMQGFYFDDRKDILRFMANDVVDRMQIPEE